MPNATKAKIRIDYYEVTAENGDPELFKNKIASILANVPEGMREKPIGTSLYNFTAEINEADKTITGSIRDLRYIVPSKGKRGTNATGSISLAEDEGISEKTYFIYNFAKNKLAIHYNYHGPKIANLFSMVNELYKEKIISLIIPALEFVRSSYKPIILGSEIELALNSNDVTCVIAKSKKPVESGELGDEADWPELLKAYDTPIDVSKELILKDKNGSLSAALKKLLRKKEDIEYYDKFQVNLRNAETNKIDVHDLVENRLKKEAIVDLNPDSKEINEASAISAIAASLNAVLEYYR